MASHSSTPSTASAVLFTLYVLAALFLSVFLLQSLRQLTLSSKSPLPSSVRVIAAFTAVSFAALSYNMLDFLAVHYTAWAGRGTSLLSLRIDLRDTWHWLEGSGLFVRFATELCESDAAFWWTGNALMHSLMVSVYMAVEGTRRQIPHLWAYFALVQILPFSFAQNLFLLALRLKPVRNNKPGNQGEPRTFWTTLTLIQLLLVAWYAMLLLSAKQLSGGPSFVAAVLAMRILLSMPYAILSPSTTSDGLMTGDKAVVSDRNVEAWDALHHAHKWAYGAIGTLQVGFMSWQAWNISQIEDSLMSALIQAPNSSPAVAALGYDWLIGFVSLVICSGLDGLREDRTGKSQSVDRSLRSS